MLSKIKILLSADDTQDEIISLLIDMAKAEATAFCHMEEYDSKLDFVVMRMVIQNYNKIGNEGFSSTSFGGVMSENYLTNYSDDIITNLKRFRKLVSI